MTRKVTNVGDTAATYTAALDGPGRRSRRGQPGVAHDRAGRDEDVHRHVHPDRRAPFGQRTVRSADVVGRDAQRPQPDRRQACRPRGSGQINLTGANGSASRTAIKTGFTGALSHADAWPHRRDADARAPSPTTRRTRFVVGGPGITGARRSTIPAGHDATRGSRCSTSVHGRRGRHRPVRLQLGRRPSSARAAAARRPRRSTWSTRPRRAPTRCTSTAGRRTVPDAELHALHVASRQPRTPAT